jgi:hypothetical protein
MVDLGMLKLVESGCLKLSLCCKILVAIGQLKHALPSQWSILNRKENELFCKIFEHDPGMLLKIGSRYDPRDF